MGFYGNKFLLKETVVENNSDIISIAYNEYCNYNNLLESCVDETERTILEAQVVVLKEVAIKDIFEKIKKIWTAFKEWFNKMVIKTKEKISEIFKKKQSETVQDNKDKESEKPEEDTENKNEDQPKDEEPPKENKINVKYYGSTYGASSILLKSLNMNRFSAYELMEETESSKDILNDLVNSMDDSFDKEKIKKNIGVDEEINYNEYIEKADNNLKEFLESDPVDEIKEKEENLTINDAKNKVTKANKTIEDMRKATNECLISDQNDIKRYEQRLKIIERKINLANDEINVTKLNKHMSMINQDIQRFRTIVNKRLKDSVKLAQYVASNNMVLSNL